MKLITVLCVTFLFCALSVQSEEQLAEADVVGELNKFEDAPENDEEVEGNTWFELQHETIEQQADQPTSGEQFIAIRIGAVGSKDQVNPGLAGLEQIATQFLPHSYTFINVVSASRQVVGGIKYELIVNALDENKSAVECDIRILEQPWIITSKNEKLRTLIFSNCSSDVPNTNESSGDNDGQRINPIFNNEETVIIMTDERLKDMESLIVPVAGTPPKIPQDILSVRFETTSTAGRPREEEEPLTVIRLSKGSTNFLDDFFSLGKTENKPIQGSAIENEVIAKLEAPNRVETTNDRGESENTYYEIATNGNGQTLVISNVEISLPANSPAPAAISSANSPAPPAISSTNSPEPPAISPANSPALPTISLANSAAPPAISPPNSPAPPAISSGIPQDPPAVSPANSPQPPAISPENSPAPTAISPANSPATADNNNKNNANQENEDNTEVIDVSNKPNGEHTGEGSTSDSSDNDLETKNCSVVNRQKRNSPNDDRAHEETLLNAALAKLDRYDKDDRKRQIVRVIKSTRNKNLFIFDVTVADTECSENNGDSCRDSIIKDSIKHCRFEIEQLDSDGIKLKKSECAPDTREKRQVEPGFVGGITPVNSSEVQSILNEVLSEGDYQTYRLQRIIESSHQLVAGSLYRIKAEFLVEQSTKICYVQIWDRPWLGKSARQVEFKCDGETTRKKRSLGSSRTAFEVTDQRAKRQIRGGITPTSESDKPQIQNLLNEVLAEGDYQSYRLVRIIESSMQIISGTRYKIKAEFDVKCQSSKVCDIQIWDRPWLGKSARKVEFNCDAPIRRKRQTHAEFGSIMVHEKEADKDFLKYIENILNEVLKSFEYQSYKLLSIIDATSQVDAGFMYQIKAELSVNDVNKICNVKIWEKELAQGLEIQEFKCQAPAIPMARAITSISDQTNFESTLNDALANSGYTSHKLVRIFEFSEEKMADVLYIVKGEFLVNAVKQICDVTVSKQVVSHENRIQELTCNQKYPILGHFNPISDDDKPHVENLLQQVLSVDEYQSYKLLKVIQSWRQVVINIGQVGLNYKIRAEVKNDGLSKICDIKILSNLTKKGKKVVEFDCQQSSDNSLLQNEATVSTNESSGAGNVVDTIALTLPGGIFTTSEKDRPAIERLVNIILASGEYPSYRLVRIIDSTQQVIAGILYRIRAEFAVDGVQKICNITVLDRPSKEEREVQEFKCDEPTPQQTGGSSSALAVDTTIQPLLGGIFATSENDRPTIEKLVNGILASGEYQSYRLVRIIESTKQVVAGILYRIRAEFAVDGVQKICNVKILDKVSNEGREVQDFKCEEPASQQTGGSSSAFVADTTIQPLLGGIFATTEKDRPAIEKLVNGILASGEYQSYRLVRIIESTKQVVAGILYRIRAEFAIDGVQKICNVKILDKVANEGREVQEFKCEEPASQQTGGSSSAFVVDTTIQPLLGGIFATSENDRPAIEKLVNGILASGKYQSYRLVRIIESTKQVVAGILYRIRAEFAIDGVQKICNVKILDKVSNEGREVEEFKCEEPASQQTGGSSSAFVADTTIQPLLGGIFATSEKDRPTIEKLVNGILARGEYQSYRVVRIIESTKQVVAGILYRIRAEFAVDGVQKICNVKILDKVSNEGREVQDFKCEEPASQQTGGSSSAFVADTTIQPFPGGIFATTEKDRPAIEKLVNGILASGEYQSYRFVRIIESTKQVVAGILYRIRAEFAVDGVQKICNVKILDKVANEGREVQDFKCEEPASQQTGGSSSAFVADTTIQPFPGGIFATTEKDRLAIEKLVNGILASGEYQSYRFVRIIESTKQVVAGILYRIRAEFAVDGVQKICNVKILDKVANEGREVQDFKCEEPASQQTGGSSSAFVADTTIQPFPGGIFATTEKDRPAIEKLVNGILASGEYQSYRLVRIIESTKQVVAGILYRIRAEFAVDGVQKICNVKILDKVANEGREVQDFKCEEPASQQTGGSSSAFVADTAIKPLLGGIFATTENDRPAIEKLVNGILARGEYQSYRLVRIIESTKQVVAGILYRIRAEFAVDGVQKICNVKILDKVSNEGREVQEFKCEEPASQQTGGSSSAFVADTTIQPLLGGIFATTENDRPAIEKLVNGILTSEEYQSYRLVRIIESTKQIVAGILYRIRAEFEVDGVQKICNVKILDKVANEGSEVQDFKCEEPASQQTGGSSSAFVADTTIQPLRGGIFATTEKDRPAIEKLVNGILTSGEYQLYRLVRIIESTKQIVAGILYRIRAEFAIDGVQKICNVKILDKVANEGSEVQDFKCEEPASQQTGGSSSAFVADTTIQPLLGGIFATTENDRPAIEKLVNGILTSGEYQSYRLVRIIESTKQIVAGILYRIRAEFEVDGVQKICNVKILDKVANEGSEVQDFKCDEPASQQTGGSSSAFVADTTIQPLRGGIFATTEKDRPAIEKLVNGILTSGEYQLYRLVRIIKSTKQIVAGILYRIRAEFEVDGVQKICNVKIWDKVANEGSEVQDFKCEEPASQQTGGSSSAFVADTTIQPLRGGIFATTEKDRPAIEKLVNGILTSGEYQPYRLVRIIESTKQIVAGILYRIRAEFAVDGVQKICNVKILDKLANEGREVQEFKCEEPASQQTGSSSAFVADTTIQPLLGSIFATTDKDRPAIEKLINGILSSGAYQSYRLVRIIESTKQVVAGILYRIRAEFEIDGAQKICNVKILDKLANEGREVQEFKCDEPASQQTGSSSAFVADTTIQPLLGGIFATTEKDRPAIEKLVNGILSSGAYQSYRLVRIIESTKQVVAGILYRIRAEFEIDGAQKICNVKILDKLANEGREVQEFKCDEPASQQTVSSSAFVADTAIQPLPGGIFATTENDRPAIEKLVNGILSSGAYQSYRLVRIIESTKQVVAGILYRIRAEFEIDGAQKICNVKILDKLANEGREVQEFKCEQPASQQTGGSSSAFVADTTIQPIPGGIFATTENDRPAIEKLVNGILASGEYQSYLLVRIIESTKQIVAGILYRIRAEFTVDGVQKICNVKILDKVANEGREVEEFKCEDPASQHTGGSSSAFVTDTTIQPLPGGIFVTTENDRPAIEKLVNGILASGEYQSYRLVRIIESTKQVVAGILYRIRAEFAVDGVQKLCNVKIWDKVANEGREVEEFKCEDLSSNILSADIIPTSTSLDFISSSIPGGVVKMVFGESVSTSNTDKFKFELSILNDVLSQGDYRAYRLVRIINSTKQVVSGLLYRIEAEFAIDESSKICKVKIWDRPWLGKSGREVEFICDDHQRRKRQILGGISPTSESDRPKIVGLLNEVLAEGDYSSYRLVRIIESSKQVVSGNLYRIEAEFAIDESPKICKVKIWDRPWLGKSGREVEFNCDDHKRRKRQIPGGISPTSDSDRPKIEGLLNEVLAEGDYSSYRLVRIIESSKQVVSGNLYRIEAEFAIDESSKICKVKIWDRPWLGKSGREVEFNCDDHNRRKRQIPGGISPTSDSDRPKIQSLLNEVLAEGDYRSYSLVKIIESSSQVVAGALFRIKAEFDVDQMRKICNVKIWDRPWLGKAAREVEFNCEDSSRSKRQIGGQIKPLTNYDTVQPLLNSVLAEGDYQSYRLVKIIGASKQVVAGFLYRITAEFDLDGAEKICEITIWKKVSNQGNEVTKFSCVSKRAIKRRGNSSSDSSSSDSSDSSERSGKRKIRNVLDDVLADDEYLSYRLVRIIQGSRQKLTSGTLYFIEAIFLVDGDSCKCNVNINERSWSNRRVYFKCDLPTSDGYTIVPISQRTILPNLITEALSQSDYKSYRVVRIIEASHQFVSLIVYRIKAEFTLEEVPKVCVIKISKQLSTNEAVVQDFVCDEPEHELQHTAVLWHKNLVNSDSVARAKRDVPPPGSPRPVEQSDYPKIESMLNSVLTEGDRQNYRLSHIIHATKQLTSGYTYKIRGVFEIDGTMKRCNIKIWNRPWLSAPNTVEAFKCDEHDEHTIRLNHDEKTKRTLDYYLNNNFADGKIFEVYEKLYNKNYSTALSRNMRFRIFRTNLRKIRDLNQHELGTATYGVTEFADLTITEYRMRTGLVPRNANSNHIRNPLAQIPNVPLPTQFDWRTRGVVSQVKNQGSCGSCWAFSVIGNIESLHAIKSGVLEEYSEQELVDCDTIDNGCNGGLPDDAYKAIEQLGGLETEKDYPYTARKDQCSFNQTKVRTQVKGAVDLPKNETAIAQWLLQNGPVSIGINANAMQFYRGGISHPWKMLCSKSNIDHGVLIVGFGVHEYPKFNKTLPYWIIKNSWGPRWGEQGYYRVYRGDNTCGVSEMVSSAVLE